MASSSSVPEYEGGRYPQDLVAIFHASFHPTKGNIIDWALKASDDLDLENLEFNVLPSGLHQVERDVIYFSKSTRTGLATFRRRPTSEPGHRGVRLSSLCVLLAPCARPRPWMHLAALRRLQDEIYENIERKSRSRAEGARGGGEEGEEGGTKGTLEPEEGDWDPARAFFEDRKVRRADLGGAGEWTGWSDELDGPYASPPPSSSPTHNPNPTLHLPHLLHILGPSSLTFYKHVLGRRRILIYTEPPVEVACVLGWVGAAVGFDVQQQRGEEVGLGAGQGMGMGMGMGVKGLVPRHKEAMRVLGMVTLSDMDRLRDESRSGRGWVACTTDALYLERPEHYDLLIDLTTCTPNKPSRPTMYTTKPLPPAAGQTRQGYRLSSVRFTWSDVKLWNEIDRILQLDSSASCASEHTTASLNPTSTSASSPSAFASQAHTHTHTHTCCAPASSAQNAATLKAKSITAWTDMYQVYDDVCILCASLWMGSWRGAGAGSYTSGAAHSYSYSYSMGPGARGGGGGAGDENAGNWGAIRLEGDDDLASTLGGAGRPYVRNVGMGIEGRPVGGEGVPLLGLGGGSTIGSAKGKARRVGAVGWGGRGFGGGGVGAAAGKRRQVSSSATGTAMAEGDTVALDELNDAEDENENEADTAEDADEETETQRRRRSQLLTTMALLQTFHAHTMFQLSVLEEVVGRQFPPPPSPSSSGLGLGSTASSSAVSISGPASASGSGVASVPLLPNTNPNFNANANASSSSSTGERILTLTPKDILAFELGPLSSLDARYLEWLVEEYAGAYSGGTGGGSGSGVGVGGAGMGTGVGGGVRAVVRRGWGWRDLVGVVFGYG